MNPIEMKAALDGALVKALLASTRPKHKPYTVELLKTLFRTLDPHNPLHIVVKACGWTVFFSAARLAEFMQKTLTSFDPALHVKRSNLCKVVDHNNLTVTIAHLPVTKTTTAAHRDGEDVYCAEQEPEIDPNMHLALHFTVNNLPMNGPLFGWCHPKTGSRALTRAEFLHCLNTAAESAGLQPLNGHGLHIGATLEYLL